MFPIQQKLRKKGGRTAKRIDYKQNLDNSSRSPDGHAIDHHLHPVLLRSRRGRGRRYGPAVGKGHWSLVDRATHSTGWIERHIQRGGSSDVCNGVDRATRSTGVWSGDRPNQKERRKGMPGTEPARGNTTQSNAAGTRLQNNKNRPHRPRPGWI